jgi:antitoxin ParD1/3/4
MHIRFSTVDELFIKNEVESGFYINATDVIRDAVRKMREERTRNTDFQRAVLKGVSDIEAGRTTPLTPEVMETLKQEGFAKARAGQPYHSGEAVPHRA